jgi:hypothetical protein
MFSLFKGAEDRMNTGELAISRACIEAGTVSKFRAAVKDSDGSLEAYIARPCCDVDRGT